jgi:hypothetical protein
MGTIVTRIGAIYTEIGYWSRVHKRIRCGSVAAIVALTVKGNLWLESDIANIIDESVRDGIAICGTGIVTEVPDNRLKRFRAVVKCNIEVGAT